MNSTTTSIATIARWQEIPALGTQGTALHCACSQGNLAAIQECVTNYETEAMHRGTSMPYLLNQLTEDGQSCLWILARQSQPVDQAQWLACWKYLLQHGANPNVPWHDQSLLQYLVALNHDAATCIALHLLRHSHVQVSQFSLCSMGPLDIALRNGNASLLRALAGHGVPWTFAAHGLPLPLRFGLAQGTLAWEALLETLEAFLQVIAPDVNVQGADGNGVVHLVAALAGKTYLRRDGKQRAHQIIDVLVRANVNLNARAVTGETALMLAARMGSTMFALALLRAGANVQVLDRVGRTAVFYAHDTILLQALVDHGADLEHTCAGRTALLHAIASHGSHPAQVQALIKAGARIATRDDRDRSALHYATSMGRDAVVSLLLSSRTITIHASVRDAEGRTPLHWLASREDLLGETKQAPMQCHGNARGCVANRFHSCTAPQYNQQVAILHSLLAHDADPTACDYQGNLPFFTLAATLARDGENDDDDLMRYNRCCACCRDRRPYDKSSARAFGLSLLLEMVVAAAGCGFFAHVRGGSVSRTDNNRYC